MKKKFDESEIWIRKCLVGREKQLGLTHLETLRSVDHLALLLSMNGPTRRSAVAGSESAIGRDHNLTTVIAA